MYQIQRVVCLLMVLNICIGDDDVKPPPLPPINKFTYDLSYAYDNSTPHWPNSLGFKFIKKIVQDNEKFNWYAANDFCVGEHGGTHLDAPYHFNRQGWKVADVPVERLIGHAFVLNVEDFNNNEPVTAHTVLQPQHLERFEQQLFGVGGTIPANTILLVRFNWARHYGTPMYYNQQEVKTGGEGEGEDELGLRFPGIGTDAARLLVARGVAGVGVDTASIDPGASTTFDSHKTLADANIFSLENVNIGSELLQHNNALIVYAMPMNIREGTGAPVRIVAVVPHDVEPQPSARTKRALNARRRFDQSMRTLSVGVAWYAHFWVVLCTVFLITMHAVDIFLSK